MEFSIKGLNVGIFTLGSTGSGKSYTMEGNQLDPGIIQHFVQGLFPAISQKMSEVRFYP